MKSTDDKRSARVQTLAIGKLENTIAVALFVGYLVSNPRNSLYAIAMLMVSYPLYRMVRAHRTGSV